VPLAAGTVIEWIVATGVDERDEHTRIVHAARRTRPYCFLAVAPIKEFSYQANTQMLQEFLQHGLDQCRVRDWRKTSGLIAAVLMPGLRTIMPRGDRHRDRCRLGDAQ
jgi:hypothetical protein